MKLVTVEDLKEGDILANDVLLDDYTVVIAKGTEIKNQYINKLRELEIFTVYIEDEDTKKEDIKNPEPKKEQPKKEQPKKNSLKKHRLSPSWQ
jgi:hypothetical protein